MRAYSFSAVRGPALRALCLAAPIVLTAAPSSGQEPPPSEQWMTHCARNLAPEQLPEAVVRNYCTCMAGLGEEAEMLTWSQTELERSYPPAHVQCHEAARK
ncbi:hypothetical protein [Methyloceanibacter sp.]|uniref:hypothetical protein n=1 Tax=Methyloceanibacter sp. TaxID=1965321 RepID=UPI002B5D5195|nr:hypothetical protein [Methyloceanibacter sp.]HML92862.1 hypothetical protein [Methyloceanibacter sp.]